MNETEIKIRWTATPAEAFAFIERHGYQRKQPRLLESDTLFDRPLHEGSSELQQQRKALRLRRITGADSAPRAMVTYKGSPQEGPHKVREEIEFEASDADIVALVFDRLGYAPWFRYEKYRSIFARPDEPGIVTVDETPIGIFMELEGPAEWIDRAAKAFGFSGNDYMTASYAGLYRAYCEKNPDAPRDMVFPK